MSKPGSRALFGAVFIGLLASLLSASCGGPRPTGVSDYDHHREVAAPEDEAPDTGPVTISVVGTNDLHGHIRALPLLAGYLRNLRAARADDGGVLVVDGGDMFQGTLESNLVEGASVIAGMNAVGYAAATVGNHEFDFGPEGELTTPQEEGDNPRGALIARAGEASFPILTANILSAETGERVDWHENMPATRIVEVAGVKIGIVGITTEETLRTTISGNVRDLRMAPLAETIVREASRLRSAGAQLVVVASHAGGKCEDCSDPTDASTCDDSQEIFEVAEALPASAVNLIVAGHTHRGVAHVVNGIPIIESYSYGVAFGRVDFVVSRTTGEVEDVQMHAPRFVCEDQGALFETCDVGEYEGAQVVREEDVAEVIAPFLEGAASVEARDLGVEVHGDFPHVIDEESAIGNLLADVIRASVEGADVGLMNGGGIRNGIDAGPLTYGELHGVFPFDNRFASATITGAELAAIVRRTALGRRSIYSVSGFRARVTCRRGEMAVELRRDNGRRIRDDEELTVATSDFLVTGGDSVLEAAWRDGRATVDEGETMRDQIADRLTELGQIRAGRRLDPRGPRIALPGPRPVTCE